MDKNKSIDGLVPRRSKKATPLKAKESVAKTPTLPKKKTTSPNQPKNNAPITPIIKTDSEAETKATPIRLTTQNKKSSPSSANITEDFLKPTQVFDFDENSGELKAAKTPTPNINKKEKSKPKKVKKPMTKKKKIIIWIISIFVALLIGGVIWLIIWGNDIIAKITGGQGNVLDLIVPSETYEPLKTDSKGRTNILAFGTSGYNMEGEEGSGTHDGAQLTDSIMVISLDQNTGDVAMLSIPRDLKASPTCTATGKINEVYWCANMDGTNEQAGANALISEVSDILGIDIQYYAHVNWGSLVQIVDTLGGITVTVDEDIYDYYSFEAGETYTLNGEESLWLARIRHGTAHGDFTRSASQQKIIIGIKDKILEKSLSITDLLSLASTLGDNLRTNFSIEEIKTLAHLSSSFDFNNMRQISLIEPEPLVTTGTINGISYVLPSAGVNRYSDIQSYVTKMFSNDPRSYEDYSILVLNATETPGLASNEKTSLEEAGFDNIYIDDAPTNNYPEGYSLYITSETAPGTKKLLEEHYSISAQTENDVPTNIPTNYDFILIVNTSQENQ